MQNDFTKILAPIIVKAGEIMLSAHDVEIAEVKKGDVNFVTEYDKAVQDFLIENIKKIYSKANFIAEEKDNDGRVIRRERSLGSYSRSFDVGEVDTESIKAKYENGVLTLTLPKKQELKPEERLLEIE